MDTKLDRLDKFAEDLILNNKSLELTQSEKKRLSTLKFKKEKDSWNKEIEYDRIINFHETPFVKDFLAARKLNYKNVNTSIIVFGTVNMHVDGSLKDGANWRTLIIFLDGEGELAYIDDNEKIQYERMKKYSTVIINDAKPHAFINKNKTLCRAIIAELEMKSTTLKPA